MREFLLLKKVKSVFRCQPILFYTAWLNLYFKKVAHGTVLIIRHLLKLKAVDNKVKPFYGLFMLFSIAGYSQTQEQSSIIARTEFQAKQVISPSPEAAALGRYGNMPVSLFTGTPNITIPLYELKGNSLSLPISLNYDASGFRPEEL